MRVRHHLAFACSLALLVGCATPLGEASRVHLGGRSFVELRVPAGWELRPVFAQGNPTTQAVRVFEGTSQLLQVSPTSWSNKSSLPAAGPAALRKRVSQALQQGHLCQGARLEERGLQGGVAMFCTVGQGQGDKRVIGAIASTRLTATFSFRESSTASASLLWQVIGTVQHFSFENEA
jgi:hypothetical protein